MPEGTRVAVMEIDGSGLRMLQGFTSDRELLMAAVNSATYQRVAESKWDPPDSVPVPGLPREEPNFTMLCNAMNFQSAQALNALNQLALFVSGVAGRKNVMWFTKGVPWLTQYQPFSRSQNLVCLSDYTRQLQAVYGRLTAERVALYPINPVGVRGEGQMSGNYDSLEDLAKETGGKAHFDNDFAGALKEDAAAGADYYALSYVPPLSKYDGKYHTIEVKVDRPGVQLEYRRGYTSLDVNGPLLEQEKTHGRAAPAKDAFQRAMGYGAPAATEVTFAVKAAPAATTPSKPGVIGSVNPEVKNKPLVRYSFDFDLPRDKITLEAQPDGSRKATFELAIAAYDVQGRVLNSLDERRSFTLKADAVGAFLAKPFVVPVEIDLPAGSVTVRAGVEDLPTEGMGVVEIPLTVGK
jgi:VWFA-related protein